MHARDPLPEAALITHPSYLVAQPILDSHHGEFWQIVNRAWDRYMAFPAEARLALHKLPTGRAGVISAFMMEEAYLVFDRRRDDGITPRGKYKPPMWSFRNKVLVRFKKVDEAGLSCNYPTPRALTINAQAQLPDEGLTESVRVDIGYHLDELQTGIEQVLISHRKNRNVVWKYALGDSGGLVLPLFPTIGPDVSEEKTFVRPRKSTPSKTKEIHGVGSE